MKYVVQGISFPDPELLARAKAKADELGVSFSNYVCRLVRRDLDRGTVRLGSDGFPVASGDSARIPIKYDGDGLAIGGRRFNDAEALALAEGAGMTMAQLRDLSEASVEDLLKLLRLERPAGRPTHAAKRKPRAAA